MGTTEKTDTYDVSNFIESIKKEVEASDNPTEVLLKKLENAEKMRRDTQASYTMTRQELKALKKEKELLRSKIQPKGISDEKLEELKFSDPDAWYKEVRKREAQAAQALNQELDEFSNKTKAEIELEERKEILRLFSDANPDFDITLPEVRDQIPPRLLKQLETGTVSFTEFLNKAKKFIETPKKVGDVPDTKTVDMGAIPGTTTPPSAKKEDLVSSYEDLIF